MTLHTAQPETPAAAAQAALVGDAFARILQNDMTPDQWARMRLANYCEGPDSIVCRSHDFRDSNMDMAEAFALIMGRQGWTGIDEEVGACTMADIDADADIWNAAWSYAKTRYLSGEDIDFASPKVGAVVEFQNGIRGLVLAVSGDGFAVIHAPGYADEGERGDYIAAFFELITHADGDTEESLTFVSDDEGGEATLQAAIAVCQRVRAESASEA